MRIPLNGNPAITNPFGVPDSNAAFGRHAGIDYGVGTGTSVYACISGEVSTVSNDQYHGNVVDIKNGDKWYRVMHLQKFVVTSGHVNEGDLIAYSDNTGLSTGPHLHWDVRTQYNPTSFTAFIDPLSLIGEENDMPNAGDVDNVYLAFNNRKATDDEKNVYTNKSWSAGDGLYYGKVAVEVEKLQKALGDAQNASYEPVGQLYRKK